MVKEQLQQIHLPQKRNYPIEPLCHVNRQFYVSIVEVINKAKPLHFPLKKKENQPLDLYINISWSFTRDYNPPLQTWVFLSAGACQTLASMCERRGDFIWVVRSGRVVGRTKPKQIFVIDLSKMELQNDPAFPCSLGSDVHKRLNKYNSDQSVEERRSMDLFITEDKSPLRMWKSDSFC